LSKLIEELVKWALKEVTNIKLIETLNMS
jgi:hypothetical protein